MGGYYIAGYCACMCVWTLRLYMYDAGQKAGEEGHLVGLMVEDQPIGLVR